jgi:hypothetical protein
MVEITLPIVLQIIQTVSISLGIIYYLFNMRNTQKARRSEALYRFLETRTQESVALKYAFVQNLDWEDYDDYQNKYGRVANHEAWAKIWSLLVEYDDIGLMVKRGIMDIEDLYELSGRSIPSLWKKFQPIIEEQRKRGDSNSMDWFQYLVEEMYKVSKRRGDNLLNDLY